MKKSALNLSKLLSFNRILGDSKKESDGVKDSKLNKVKDFTKEDEKQKVNNAQEVVNKDEKEVKIKKTTTVANMQNKGESSQEQEYIELSSIDSIYRKNNFALANSQTIFMAETYLKTLPDYLPEEVKRKTVLDIIESSSLNADKLLADGEERKRTLNKFMQKFSQTTDKIVKDHENEIRKPTDSIKANERAIENRKSLQVEQTALINYEVHRLQKS